MKAKATFSAFLALAEPLAEEKQEIETINLNRLDPYDLAQLALRAALHSAYDELKRRQGKHEDFHDKNDEDYEPFDFSAEALLEEADQYLDQLVERLKEMPHKTKVGAVSHYFSDVKPRAKLEK